MVSIALFTQQAFALLACALFVNGLVIPADDSVSKRSGSGFVKLDFDITKKLVPKNETIAKSKRGDASAPLQNNQAFYAITLDFGSQAQPISVDLDTGSSDLWVPDSSATSGGFNSADSSSLTNTNQPFQIGYVDGSQSSGTFVLDTVAIPNGPSLNQFQFADVTSTSVSQGGILGIGPTTNEAGTASGGSSYPNFPISLKNAGYINKNAYSIYLDALDASTGSIIFGGIDTAKYEGQLVTRPFTQNTGIVINLDSVTTPSGNDVTANVDAIYDTGTSLTYIPDSIVSAIADSIQGATWDSDAGQINLASCTLPSDSYISYKFGDATIQVPLSDLAIPNSEVTSGGDPNTCILGVLGNSQSRGDNLLGDTFLRRAYFVADYDSQTAQVAQVKYTSESNIVAIN